MRLHKFISYLFPTILMLILIASTGLKTDLVSLTFFLTCLQSSIFLGHVTQKKVNLISVFYLFNLSFLGFFPWLHYSNEITIMRSVPISDITAIYTNMLIFMANILTYIAYSLAYKKKSDPLPSHAPPLLNVSFRGVLLLFLSGAAFLGVMNINDFSFQSLLLRGYIDQELKVSSGSSAIAVMLETLFRLTPVFCFLYAVTSIPRRGLLKLILLALMLFSVFPTGVARFMAAFTYIPIFIFYIKPLRNAATFSNFLLINLILVFPFLDQFRFFRGLDELYFLPKVEFFMAPHFDAFENFASVVESGFVSHGYQLLGVLLFFVPRVFWPTKPVGSGFQLAADMNYAWNNISMPFLAEGYVNFGIAGVVLFSLALGIFMSKLDSHFASILASKHEKTFSLAIYFFLIGALFFIMRGDLLSSFSFTLAGIIIALFLKTIMRLLRKRNTAL